MSPEEQEARSRVQTRCAIIVPLENGDYGVFRNDRQTMKIVEGRAKSPINEVYFNLVDAIKWASTRLTIPIPLQKPRPQARHFNERGKQTDKINIEELKL